ncbi:helix-hairpin-helix domain-containing protein [Billgrantia sp. Q4P2]|uniref:helix-hairpin-helix domain-containing protein n=1 Tax=Billgrantia sp. Q4P2 TaxID=3463857 RepID=UPI004056B3CE
MPASPFPVATGQAVPDRATALALQSLAQRLERELLAALESKSSQAAVDRLETISACCDQLADALQQIDSQQAQPVLESLRLGLDRYACDLYQRGGWEHLDDTRRTTLLSRHAIRLTQVKGVGPASAQVLFVHGISDPERLHRLEPQALDEIEGLNAAVLARLKEGLEAAPGKKAGAQGKLQRGK